MSIGCRSRRELLRSLAGGVAVAIPGRMLGGADHTVFPPSADDGRTPVFVRDFGAVGNGLTDDTGAINRAIGFVLAHSGTVLQFDDTTYRVGSSAVSGASLFTLRGTAGFAMRGRPRFRVDRTNTRQVTVFDIQMSDVEIEYIEVTGDPFAVDLATAIQRGVIACLVRSPSGDALARHWFGAIVVTNGLHALLYDANDRRWGRASDVSVDLIQVRNCVYAFNGANAPDRHRIGRIVADNVFRGYFVYGVDDGRVDIAVGPRYSGIFAGGTCANIAVYTETRPGASVNRVADTRNITISIRNESSRPSLQLSTNSMAAADRAQGHYDISATVTSDPGSVLKVSNVNIATGQQDTSAPYASPKQNIAVVARLPRGGGLDPTAFGLWSSTRNLTLDVPNFATCNAAVKRAYLASGWQIGKRPAT